MKLVVENLKSMCQVIVDRYEHETKEHQRYVEWSKIQHTEHYNTTVRQQWINYRNAITEALKKRRPVVKGGIGDPPPFFYPSNNLPSHIKVHEKPRYVDVNRASLAGALLAFLEACPDKIVSSSALKDLGFHDLNALYRTHRVILSLDDNE